MVSDINKNSFPFQKESLENLITSEKEKIMNDGRDQFHNLNIIMIKSAIKNQDSSYTITQDEINYLSDYLFNMEIWIEYELILYIYNDYSTINCVLFRDNLIKIQKVNHLKVK